jgi:uroporphyrinogen III methyltransferase/synthase
VDLTPPEYRADAVLDAMRAFGDLGGARVLLPRADIGREVIGEELRGAGADVLEVIAYRTIAAQADREGDTDVYRLLLDRQIDAVTFTSASTVRNFAEMLGRDQSADLLHGTAVACIGPVTAEAAQQLGIATTIMPTKYTIPDLVTALVHYFAELPTPT